MINVLVEPVIRMDKSSGSRVEASLPEIYAALMADEVDAFPALRPHQRHAWHAFLTQLGAMVVHLHPNGDNLPEDAEEWIELIRELTPEYPEDEPWQLAVEDITKPAFMQPPASNWTNYDKRDLFQTPDALDMLDTAKNHDLKSDVGMDAKAEDWIFSLIAMQTMNGQVGRGNYPVARMNSGDGSRTAFSVTPSSSPGMHLRRDILAMLNRSSDIIGDLPFRWDGLCLLWTKLWDGKKALPLSDLHPFYIEICRRRRLRVDADGHLYAMKAASGYRRIEAAKNNGVVGDPWTLVDLRDKKGNKALTLQPGGFTYRRIVEYLTSGDWEPPVLSQAMPDEPVVQLQMRGIRRKKGGQTEGYYERSIPITGKTRRTTLRSSNAQDLAELGGIAQDRIEQIGIVQTILTDSVATFITHGKALRHLTANERRRVRNDAKIWSNRLDMKVDAEFFKNLQDEFEIDDDAERELIRNEWLMNGEDGVIDHARNILHDAEDSLPCRAIYRYCARVNAEGLFEGRIRGNSGLPFLFLPEKEDNEQ